MPNAPDLQVTGGRIEFRDVHFSYPEQSGHVSDTCFGALSLSLALCLTLSFDGAYICAARYNFPGTFVHR